MQNRQWTYDVTLWSVRVTFLPRRLSYERDIISLQVSQFTGMSCHVMSGTDFKQSVYVTTTKFH
jgi:hypothetical protein